MASPIDASWSNDILSDGNLNKTTYGQGTSFPSTWRTDRIFLRTDSKQMYLNTGTEASPVWTILGGEDPPANSVVMPYDETISNYVTFATETTSSNGSATASQQNIGTVPQNHGLGSSANTPSLVMNRELDGGNAHDVTNLYISYTVYANNNGWRYHQLDMVTSSGTTTVVPYQSVGDWATTTYTHSAASVSGFIGYKMYGRSYYGTDYATVTSCYATWAPTIPSSNLVDDDTTTFWISTEETNPWCTIETGSSSLCDHVAIYPSSDNTETEVTIQYWNGSAWVTVRTITMSNLTNGQWNYIRFNPITTQKFRIYGNSGLSKKLSISEIKVKNGITESDVVMQHGHILISSTDTSIGLDGT